MTRILTNEFHSDSCSFVAQIFVLLVHLVVHNSPPRLSIPNNSRYTFNMPFKTLLAIFLISSISFAEPTTTASRPSVFYPPTLIDRMRTSANRDDWGKALRKS